MWLIDTKSLKLRHFVLCPMGKYAILSHTWEDDELDFDTFQTEQARKRKGFWKVEQCCAQARECMVKALHLMLLYSWSVRL